MLLAQIIFIETIQLLLNGCKLRKTAEWRSYCICQQGLTSRTLTRLSGHAIISVIRFSIFWGGKNSFSTVQMCSLLNSSGIGHVGQKPSGFVVCGICVSVCTILQA